MQSLTGTIAGKMLRCCLNVAHHKQGVANFEFFLDIHRKILIKLGVEFQCLS